MKKCASCRVEKDNSMFGKDNHRKDGLNPYCNECRRLIYLKNREQESKRGKIRYQKNKEKMQVQSKNYRESHREQVILSIRNWWNANKDEVNQKRRNLRKANPDLFKEQNKRYREKHLEQLNEKARKNYPKYRQAMMERAKAWKARNKDKVREMTRKYRKDNPFKVHQFGAVRRARLRNVPSTLDAKQWEWLLESTNFMCLACGATNVKLTQDHLIPLNPGHHTLDNIQPLCGHCNPSKQRKTIDYRPDWLKEMIRKKMIELGLELTYL